MDSKGLELWQVERLFKRVQYDLRFLDKLEGRMHQKHFPASDPIYENVQKARAAVNELAIQLNHLMKNLPS